ncbi:LysR family transcriptional regulator [Gordonia sp. TBRC 11910]|uniref:LysR family transcriptional regulator n=1 Tax=Gordonia asplenii TaxID=2725283 RepID=A0A848L1X4_9ACTN|nr:LysR family transcriptional regulator [Gordonia asplenii]NMO03085.1 LysR family transcriptional regulator [Gordonia asplenii]
MFRLPYELESHTPPYSVDYAELTMGSFNRLHMIRQIDAFSLRLFVSAIEERQIGLAAEREYIAPSTATKRIQALEDLVGVSLLERGRDGVVATAAGTVLERYARSILAELDALVAELSRVSEEVEGRLVVAAAHSVIIDLLAPVVSAFVAERPLVDLSLQEMDNAEVIRHISAGECDVGVFARVGTSGPLDGDTRLLASEPLVAVLPIGHPLADRESLTYRDLADHELIATATMASAFEHVAQRLGRPANLRHVVRTGEVALGMVRAGLGITVVPQRMITAAADSSMLVRTLDEPWAVRQINVVTRGPRATSQTAKAFVDTLIAQTSML